LAPHEEEYDAERKDKSLLIPESPPLKNMNLIRSKPENATNQNEKHEIVEKNAYSL
jgi:hypothetical protein